MDGFELAMEIFLAGFDLRYLVVGEVKAALHPGQVGPGLVLIPVVVWLFWKDQTLWGTAMIVWTIFVGTIDSVIRTGVSSGSIKIYRPAWP